jgi:thiol-disulfide isomerase/thioredoxin
MMMLASAAVSIALLAGGLMSAEPQGSAPVAPAAKAPQVDPALYKNAAWPAHNTDLYAKDLQGQRLPVALGQETWLTEKQDLTGKVLVLDFWATWCGPCIAAEPKLEKLTKDFAGKVAVIGISGQREEQSKVESHLAKHEPKWVYLHDAEQRVYKPFESRGIPLVVVVSTDGVIRWMGNPHHKEFHAIVGQVIAADPLIKAKSAG